MPEYVHPYLTGRGHGIQCAYLTNVWKEEGVEKERNCLLFSNNDDDNKNNDDIIIAVIC